MAEGKVTFLYATKKLTAAIQSLKVKRSVWYSTHNNRGEGSWELFLPRTLENKHRRRRKSLKRLRELDVFPSLNPKCPAGGERGRRRKRHPPSLSLSFASRRPWPEAAETETSQRRKRKRWLMDAFNAYDGVCCAGGDGSSLPKAGGRTAHATSPNVFGFAAEPK